MKKKYKVRYYECYQKTYNVEADSKEEAKKILTDLIAEGKENPPEECYDSGAEVVESTDESMMELAVHMKNSMTGEERIKKVRGINALSHDPVDDFYYGSVWTWIGTEPFKNVSGKVKHIGRGYYRIRN